MNASVLTFLSAVSEKKTSGLFKFQAGVSITEFALIFLTLMPASFRAGAIRIPNVGIAFETEVVWSEYIVISWI